MSGIDNAREMLSGSVVVIGGGLAGLVAAYECARVGLAVTIVEQSEQWGLPVRTVQHDAATVDVGSDHFLYSDSDVAELCQQLGIDSAQIDTTPVQRYLAGGSGAALVEFPRNTVLGIPANPWDRQLRSVIGWGGCWRAWFDRIRPPLTIGRDRQLKHLVSKRVGKRVYHRLTAPAVRSVFSADPEKLDVDVAVPGLNAALTRSGALTAAADMCLDGAEIIPQTARLQGGLHVLVDALRDYLSRLNVNFVSETTVTELTPLAEHRWRCQGEKASTEAWSCEVDGVVIATGPDSASTLVQSMGSDFSMDVFSTVPPREHLTLIGDDPTAESLPLGQIMAISAEAGIDTVDHRVLDSAQGRAHLLQIRYRSVRSESKKTPEDACAELAELCGVSLAASRFRILDHQRLRSVECAYTQGHAKRAARARAFIADRAEIAVVGSWLAGSDVSHIIADSRREADRLRSFILWSGTTDAEKGI